MHLPKKTSDSLNASNIELANYIQKHSNDKKNFNDLRFAFMQSSQSFFNLLDTDDPLDRLVIFLNEQYCIALFRIRCESLGFAIEYNNILHKREDYDDALLLGHIVQLCFQQDYNSRFVDLMIREETERAFIDFHVTFLLSPWDDDKTEINDYMLRPSVETIVGLIKEKQLLLEVELKKNGLQKVENMKNFMNVYLDFIETFVSGKRDSQKEALRESMLDAILSVVFSDPWRDYVFYTITPDVKSALIQK